MSYIVTRTFTPESLADVLAFKTKREAMQWMDGVQEFWAKAIKRKQVHIAYVGKSPLQAGVYMGYEPEITWKCSEKGEKHDQDTEGRRVTRRRPAGRPGREAQASQTTGQEPRSVDRREERLSP